MLFFKKKKKDDAIEIKAYFEGTVLPLEKVNDPMFSDKLMGDGVAIEPRCRKSICSSGWKSSINL